MASDLRKQVSAALAAELKSMKDSEEEKEADQHYITSMVQTALRKDQNVAAASVEPADETADPAQPKLTTRGALRRILRRATTTRK